MDSTCNAPVMVGSCEPAIVLAIGPARVASMDPMMGSVWTRVMVLGPAPAIGSCGGF